MRFLKEIPEAWVSDAMAASRTGSPDAVRAVLANVYDAVREDVLWEAVKSRVVVTCACGMVWDLFPEGGPDEGHDRDHCESGAIARIRVNGVELRIKEWRLSPHADFGGQTGRWSISGWLQNYYKDADFNDARLEHVILPGRTCPTGQTVSVTTKNYGDGRGRFVTVKWSRDDLPTQEGEHA